MEHSVWLQTRDFQIHIFCKTIFFIFEKRVSPSCFHVHYENDRAIFKIPLATSREQSKLWCEEIIWSMTLVRFQLSADDFSPCKLTQMEAPVREWVITSDVSFLNYVSSKVVILSGGASGSC